jgi:hypothetical protein
MWMTTLSTCRRTELLEAFEETEKTISGGSALTEASELTVIATGRPPRSAVTTVTPEGCLRNADLKVSAGSDSARSAAVRWIGGWAGEGMANVVMAKILSTCRVAPWRPEGRATRARP